MKVAADCIVLESIGVKVDHSSLTGEAEPLKRVPRKTDDNPFESRYSSIQCLIVITIFIN
jgi:magnesium-transporting ATPase (P-type)